MKGGHKIRKLEGCYDGLLDLSGLGILSLLVVSLAVMWFYDSNIFSLVSQYDLSLRSYGQFSKNFIHHVPKSVLVFLYHLYS